MKISLRPGKHETTNCSNGIGNLAALSVIHFEGIREVVF